MKIKILSFVLLTVILSLAVVSAADFTITVSNDLSKTVNSTLVKIKNTNVNNSITVNVGNIADISDGDSHTILINQNKVGSFTIAPNTEETVNVSYTDFNPSSTDPKDLALGKFATSILVTQGTETVTGNINFVSTFCESGDRQEVNSDGTRRLEIISVTDQSSDKDWEWKPLDKVELEVKVRFRSGDNNDDIDGIIEVGLYDSEDKNFVDTGSDTDLQVDFSLDEGDSTTETINLEVPVQDLQDSSSRYKLYVKAYQDGDEDVVCSDSVEDFKGGDNDEFFQDIKIKKETYDVVLDETDVTTPVPCGEEVQVNYKVFNVGTKDEDRVQVYLTNTQLGLNLESEVFKLNEGDSDTSSFSFVIPQTAKEGSYNLRMYTAYRYSSSTDNFREKSKDFFPAQPLVIQGGCSDSGNGGDVVNGTTQQNVQITAELGSETPEAVAGKNVIVKANLLNTGSTTTTYSVSIFGNSAWSNVVSVNPQIVTLEPGQSRIVDITLTVDEQASGDQEFTIKSTYGANKSKEQKVQLSIASGSSSTTGGNFDSVTEHFRKNWFIYVIIIVNLVLIIAIIAVIRRITRPRRTVIHEM